MDFVTGIVLSMLIVVPFALIGKAVQRVAHFILPWDFFTAIIACVLLLFIPLALPLLVPAVSEYIVFVLPAMMGYILGYYLASRREWMMIAHPILGSPTAFEPMYPIVPYLYEGVQCIQDQCWSGLWNRLRHNIHHTVECNAPLVPNLLLRFKYPFFLAMQAESIVVDYIYEDPEAQYVEIGRERKKRVKVNGKKETIFYRKTKRVYHTEIGIPDAMLASPLERMLREDTHIKTSRTLVSLRKQLIVMEEQAKRGFSFETARLFQDAVNDTAVETEIINYINEKEKNPPKVDRSLQAKIDEIRKKRKEEAAGYAEE